MNVVASEHVKTEYWPWLKDTPVRLQISVNEQAKEIFFSNYILHPCNHGLSPGYLERLPELLSRSEKRSTLELCCSATSLAYLAVLSQQNDIKVYAHQTYDRALAALSKSITDPEDLSSDGTLTAILVIDFFDMFLGERTQHSGPHSKALAAILAMRKESMLLSPTGFSIFRVAYQRVQTEQILSIVSGGTVNRDQIELERCLAMLNPSSIYTQLTTANQDILKLCAQTENVLRADDEEIARAQVCATVKFETTELYTKLVLEDEAHFPSLRSREVYRPHNAPRPANAIIEETKLLVYHDLWLANEWTLHQGFRLILLDYLARLLHFLLDNEIRTTSTWDKAKFSQQLANVLESLEAVAEAIFASVPMLAGTIDDEGNFFSDARGKRIGAFFILSPLKLISAAHHTSLGMKTKARSLLQQMHLYMELATMVTD